MSNSSDATDLTAAIGRDLPYLRRYARALTGTQRTGDNYAAATLEAILEAPASFSRDLPAKTALFKVFHGIWSSSGAPVDAASTGLEAKAQAHLSRLTKDTREVLLLHTIEQFGLSDIAQILAVDEDEVTELLNIAHREMGEAVAGRVLIIEDEAIIALDIENMVTEMGHTSVGNARTRADAVALVQKERPDLILADIQLADNSSGIDAVNEILSEHGDIPVIFITAFPERLLTGERPEPAFLITKPYTEDQVRSAVSQAMFFASTETLHT